MGQNRKPNSYKRAEHSPIPASSSPFYDAVIPTGIKNRKTEDIMMRTFPMTWAALNVGLASAATYMLCTTDLLHGAVVLLVP